MKVLKFGGTSVGKLEAVRNLKEIILKEKKANEPLIVVCSAFSGVTNLLLEAVENALKGEDFSEILLQLEKRHYEMIAELLPRNVQNPLLMLVKSSFNTLEDILTSVARLGELSERTKACVIGYGEQLSCPIISAFLSPSMDSQYVDARQLIVTDSNYLKASVDFDSTNAKIQTWYNELTNGVYVVTGFIGANRDGNTATLGRGGSDYTAAILGAALNADEMQIWTDVDGFLTADPCWVEKAFVLDYLSYQEAMELSYFGAKVIYPPSLVPAISAKIPVWIKNTFEPEKKGTEIGIRKELENKALITGISSINNLALINIVGGGIVGLKGFSARLFQVLSDNDINIILITQASSEYSISFAVSTEDSKKAKHVLEQEFAFEIEKNIIQQPEVDNEVSVLAIVGEKMRNTKGISGKLFQTLGKYRINVMAIAQGSSELNISVVIAKKDLGKALKVVHDALLLSPIKTYHIFCIGTGNIGEEFLNQISKEEANLLAKHNIQISVHGISNSRKMLLSKNKPISIANWKADMDSTSETANLDVFVDFALEMDMPNVVVIDNTSSKEVSSKYEAFFRNGISVVTCNKIANSESFQQYENLKQTAEKNGANFLYETNVGAGLPIIKTLHDLLISGDEIRSVEAILSGTISFIFNSYVGDVTFAEVVENAQKMGFTEPDPRDDLNGLDFSRKMLILAREIGIPLELQEVKMHGFIPEVCMQQPSVADFYKELKNQEPYFSGLKSQAEKEGKRLRLIGTLQNGEVNVGLKMVDNAHPFYGLAGSDNIIAITTERYHNTPLVVKGPGAGASVTAAGVFADLVRVTNS